MAMIRLRLAASKQEIWYCKNVKLLSYVKRFTCTIWLNCQAVTPGAYKLLSLIILDSGSDGDIVGWDLRGVTTSCHEIKRIVQLAQYKAQLSQFSFHLNTNIENKIY